ncbi:folylpolyglutamate synthase, mitochondrial [Nilaparvata lugens]|uniref:folylpolyglutamate synthase, mitochondrial n=1 Tax=Nilaparvata lugens TaxID=108931 RepID=UPI00193E043C|nr:folylpolyglutamate synthase, mitochondrial [Nilaparvata lugens]
MSISLFPRKLLSALQRMSTDIPTIERLFSRSVVSNENTTEYKDAITLLNCLQSNVINLKECTRKVETGIPKQSQEECKVFLKRTGIEVETLESSLSVIHVSGTKGKGSTCAYCESVLRSHGYRTGFFSSPHLVAVRERIRINGLPVSEEAFVAHFWNVYRRLEANKDEYDGSMPFYFSFLTVMAIHVFLAEQVDVAVIEVGIGGENDCTNIFSNTPIVGITSLGLDHTKLLGDRIEQIAWQKAGIIKPRSTVIVARGQPPSALHVLKERSRDNNCTLIEAPPIDDYKLENYTNSAEIIKKSFDSSVIQELNVSLALQLSYAWMAKCKNRGNLNMIGKGLTICERTLDGINKCYWPGRQQILESNDSPLTYYIDGAHTKESMHECVSWFNGKTKTKESVKVLLFNVTSNRDSYALLSLLDCCRFDTILFSTNIANQNNYDITSDQANLMTSVSSQLDRCREHLKIWQELTESRTTKREPQTVSSFPTVRDALDYLENLSSAAEKREFSVLVTGSLHLVGAFFSAVDPDLTFMKGKIS